MENEIIEYKHTEYVIEYRLAQGINILNTDRFKTFDAALDRLKYMLERNKVVIDFVNMKFYKSEKTVYDISKIKLGL